MKFAQFVFLMIFISNLVFAEKINFTLVGQKNFAEFPPNFALKIDYERFPGLETGIISSQGLLHENITRNLGAKNTTIYSDELLHNALFFFLFNKVQDVFGQLNNPGFDTENFNYGDVIIIDRSRMSGFLQTHDLEYIDESNVGLVQQKNAFELYRLLHDFRVLGLNKSGITIRIVDAYEPSLDGLVEKILKVGQDNIPNYLQTEYIVERELCVVLERFSSEKSIIFFLKKNKEFSFFLSIILLTLLYNLVPYLKTMELFKQR